jgi:hypothetical protein
VTWSSPWLLVIERLCGLLDVGKFDAHSTKSDSSEFRQIPFQTGQYLFQWPSPTSVYGLCFMCVSDRNGTFDYPNCSQTARIDPQRPERLTSDVLTNSIPYNVRLCLSKTEAARNPDRITWRSINQRFFKYTNRCPNRLNSLSSQPVSSFSV